VRTVLAPIVTLTGRMLTIVLFPYTSARLATETCQVPRDSRTENHPN